MGQEKNKDIKLTCNKCKVQLALAKTDFSYLGKAFHADVLRCPKCGKVCILPEIAEGKMAEVEQMLEEK